MSTTSVDLYKELYAQQEKRYREKHEVVYNAYSLPPATTDISQLLRNKEVINETLSILKSNEVASFNFDAAFTIKAYYMPKISMYQDQLNSLKASYEAKKEKLVEDHKVKAALTEKSAKESVAPLVKKHLELMEYKESLVNILLKFNIMPSDIKISEDITEEEFMALLESSISICRKLTKEHKNITKFLYWPFEQHNTDFAICYLVSLIIVFYFTTPFLSVAFIGYLFYSTITIYKKIDKLRIAESMMYNVDFDKFIPKVEFEIEDLDTTEVDDWYKSELAKLEEIDPTKQCDVEVMTAVSHLDEITRQAGEVYSSMKAKHRNMINIWAKALQETQDAIDAYMKNCKEFGTVISTSSVLSHKYVVGRIKDTIDISTEYKLENFVFDNSNREAIMSKMRLYFCNTLLNVKQKHLYVTIYDPDNLGADFADFFSNTTQEYIKIRSDNPDTILNAERSYVQDNIKIFGESTIDEYNTESEKIGKITRDYHLLIFLSELKKIKDSTGFSKFMEYSAKYGVLIWMLDNEMYTNTRFIKADYEFDGVPIPYTPVLGAKVMKTFEYAIENSKIDGIDYFKGFAAKYMPKDKWWTGNTKKGIALRFGLADGDPSKGFPMYLDDKNVHCLMVGGTGSGKSVAINQMLMSLCCEYSPNELEIVGVDFKNVEFSTFSRQADTGLLKDGTVLETIRNIKDRYALIPHAKVWAGTKDGEYAVSIFDYLCAEMDRRTEIFSKAGCKNIMEYRDKYPNEIMPRILCLIDEFQVMFTEVDPKMVDIIRGRITSLSKLARFCGCHLWFTSQSMKGTLDKDILEQFTLRVALRCASTVSTDIIGNPAAGKIKDKVGWLYTNDSAGEDRTRNQLWRVPFAPTDGIMKTIEELLVKTNSSNVVKNRTEFYDQKLIFNKDKFDENYDTYPDALSDPHLMVLGERTSYSTNRAPEHFKFTKDDGENLCAVAFERADMLNLAMTFIDNIKRKGDNATLVMHSADRDAHTLLDIPNLVSEGLANISDPNQNIEELISAMEDMVSNRQSKKQSELKPLYFVLIQWEKAKCIARDENMKVQDRFKRVLQEAPIVDVHFIFIGKELGNMPNFVYSACSHKIAGKVGDRESSKYIESLRATKLPQPTDGIFAIYKYGSTDIKFKIYQHVFTKKLESRTVMIK